MAEIGSKLQEVETLSDTSDEDSFISRRRGSRQQVRADVHATAEGPATDRKRSGNSGNGRRRPETTGKHQTSTVESGSRSRGTEAQMEMSKEGSDEHTETLRRRRRPVRVRSEICMPHRSQRG